MINWHGYTVFENGTILNKDGTVKNYFDNGKGYLCSTFVYEGKTVCHGIHVVVALAFLGPRPDGHEVDHIDNNRQNNHISNLRWISASENNKKSYEVGNRNASGKNNANAKYSTEQLKNVYSCLRSGMSYGKVVAKTGVNKGTVAKIAQGKHYLSGTFRD